MDDCLAIEYRTAGRKRRNEIYKIAYSTFLPFVLKRTEGVTGADLEDLMSNYDLKIVHALNNWNGDKCKFKTYLFGCIRGFRSKWLETDYKQYRSRECKRTGAKITHRFIDNFDDYDNDALLRLFDQ